MRYLGTRRLTPSARRKLLRAAAVSPSRRNVQRARPYIHIADGSSPNCRRSVPASSSSRDLSKSVRKL